MNSKEKVLIFAHRGASKLAPENTLKAFKKAVELEADFIELDVHETNDGILVVTHDDDIFRITSHQGYIKDLTLNELKSLNFGEGEKIPTLYEVIEVIKGIIGLNCEIKVTNISQKVSDLLKKYKIDNSVIISSFLHEELLKLQNIEPKFKLVSLEPTQFGKSYNREEKKQMIQFCIDNNFYAINPFYILVDQQFVDYAHNNNIKVFPWTVDSKPIMRRLLKFGVDGIITNDVEKLKKVLKQEI